MSAPPRGPTGPSQRVLVVSARLSPARRRALARLTGGAVADVMALDGPLPAPAAYSAVMVDGVDPGPGPRPEPAWIAALQRWVVAGGPALVIGGPAAGAGDPWASFVAQAATAGAGRMRPGEWFAKPVGSPSPFTERLPVDFPLADHFQALVPAADAAVVLVVNVAYRDAAAMVSAGVGAGRVVVSGLGHSDASLAHPELGLVLRRCLAPGAEARAGAPVGLAVVGYGPYGGMGQFHGQAARATAGLELIATCDSHPDRRKAAESDFPGLRAYTTVEELAVDPDVGVVVVATPPSSHTAIALALLRAGKHVALEKPMCFSVAEADQLMAAATDHGRVLTVNQNRRWDADFRAVRQAVEDGWLGELFNMETFVGGFAHPCRAWHSEVTVSGGAAYDWGSHHLDWVLALMGGPPATVAAHGHKRVWHDVTNLDQLRVRLGWPDGREAEFVQSDVAGVRRPKFYLQGTAGTLVGHYRPLTFERVEPGRGYVAEIAHHAEAPAELTLARYHSGWGLTETRLPVAPELSYPFHRNLADHLHRGEPLAVTPESVRPVVAVLEAAQRSSLEGGAVVALDLG